MISQIDINRFATSLFPIHHVAQKYKGKTGQPVTLIKSTFELGCHEGNGMMLSRQISFTSVADGPSIETCLDLALSNVSKDLQKCSKISFAVE